MFSPERVVAFVCDAFCVHGVHMCMALHSPCMARHEYKVAPNIGKPNCIFSGGVVPICFCFSPMLHST